MRSIDRVLETILYVDDLDAAERFYGDVLGLKLDSRKDGLFVFFKCGAGMLLLFEPRAASVGRNVPAHGAHGPGHACFAVAEADLEYWKERLQAAGVAIEQEVDWPWVKHGADPHGPFGSVICAAVSRLSRSLLATRTIRIDVSSS